jgi:hypothetical protein
MKNYSSPSIEMILMSVEDVLGVSWTENAGSDADNINTWDGLFGGGEE